MNPRDVTALVFTAIVVVLAAGTALAVTIAERGGGKRRPPLFQVLIAALDTAGRLLHIRWPGWLINWAWHRQATPGPEELRRKARHREPRVIRRVYGGTAACLHAAWRAVTRLVGDDEWSVACHRIRRWQPDEDRAEVKR